MKTYAELNPIGVEYLKAKIKTKVYNDVDVESLVSGFLNDVQEHAKGKPYEIPWNLTRSGHPEFLIVLPKYFDLKVV